MKTKGII